MELIEGITEITALCNKYKRLRKREKPVELVVEDLNKLGARRPTKQRFSLSYDHRTGHLCLNAKDLSCIPSALQLICNTMNIECGRPSFKRAVP